MLSDCVKCWCTPCQCRYEYRNLSYDQLGELIAGILTYKNEEERTIILLKAKEYLKNIPWKIDK